MPAPPPSRRALVTGALLLPVGVVTAACRTAPPAPPALPATDPDDAVRLLSAEAETALLAAYDDALAADPVSAARLAPLRAEHAAHLAALGLPAPSAVAALTTGDLVAAERTAAARHARGALDARDPALAQLLGTLSASEASHVVALA